MNDQFVEFFTLASDYAPIFGFLIIALSLTIGFLTRDLTQIFIGIFAGALIINMPEILSTILLDGDIQNAEQPTPSGETVNEGESFWTLLQLVFGAVIFFFILYILGKPEWFTSQSDQESVEDEWLFDEDDDEKGVVTPIPLTPSANDTQAGITNAVPNEMASSSLKAKRKVSLD